MKCFIPLSLLVASVVAAPTAAPSPQEGASFPITDLVDSDLTVEEYASQLESQPAGEHCDYRCRAVTVIFARGTTQSGNVGEANSEGPVFFNALASRLGGAGQLAIQGVDYPANVIGFLAGGDAAGATTMFNLINRAVTQCPATKIVVSGYSQGAQLVHTATQRLSAANAAKVSAVVTFGDADRDESFGQVAANKVMIICHDGDNICDNGIIITPAHRNYEIDAPAAADFVRARTV